MARVLITGGRAPVSLELARMFHRRGHRVIIVESQAAQVSRRSSCVHATYLVPPPRQQTDAYVQALLKIVREERVDVVIPTCEEVFYVARAHRELSQLCRLWTDTPDVLRSLHDKWTFNSEARAMGLPTPLSFRIESRADLETHADRPGQWVLKPVFSRFGHHVRLGTIGELLNQDLPTNTWVLQEYIEGPEYCVYALADSGRLLAFSIYVHDFVAGRAGICFEERDCPQITAVLAPYIRALNYTGQIAFDFIVRGNLAYALECNPRATSGIHLLATCPRFADLWLKPEQAEATPVCAKTGTRAMLLLAMLCYGLTQVTGWSRLRTWLRNVMGGREVMWSWSDPLPFFDQLFCVAQLSWQALRSQVSVLAISTHDIEWNGEA
jgi:hypothetical protein